MSERDTHGDKTVNDRRVSDQERRKQNVPVDKDRRKRANDRRN